MTISECSFDPILGFLLGEREMAVVTGLKWKKELNGRSPMNRSKCCKLQPSEQL